MSHICLTLRMQIGLRDRYVSERKCGEERRLAISKVSTNTAEGFVQIDRIKAVVIWFS